MFLENKYFPNDLTFHTNFGLSKERKKIELFTAIQFNQNQRNEKLNIAAAVAR